MADLWPGVVVPESFDDSPVVVDLSEGFEEGSETEPKGIDRSLFTELADDS